MHTTLEYKEGYQAYLDGISFCPYDYETDEYYDWHEGFDQSEQDELDQE